MSDNIEVTGVGELVKSLRGLDSELAKEVTDVMRRAAMEGRDLAREIAEREGLGAPGRSGRGTGALIQGIGYGVRDTARYGVSAFITEKAVNSKGYPYPAVWEFRKDGLQRPFMRPAARIEGAKAYTEIEAAADHVIKEAGLD